MKNLIFVCLVLCHSTLFSQDYIISYPSYTSGSPVIIKVKVDGDQAIVNNTNYQVLQNNETGIVLARSFAQESTKQQPHRGALGLFCIVLDKKNKTVTRGNILSGEAESSIAIGTYIESK